MSKHSLIPKLAPGQCSVVFADANTGILLTPEGEWHIGPVARYRVFNSEQEATAFAREHVEQYQAVECSIRNEDGEHMRFVRKE